MPFTTLAVPLAAQQTTGTITGRVQDISGAFVEVLNCKTNAAGWTILVPEKIPGNAYWRAVRIESK